MRGFLKLVSIEFKMFYREPVAMFFTVIFPIMLLFIFGSIYGNEPTSFFGGVGYVDTAVPAFTSMIISMTGLLSITVIFTTYREQGILRRLQSTPIQPQAILSAILLILFLLNTLGMILLVIFGKIVYSLQFSGNVFTLFCGFTISSIAFFSIGFVLCGLIKTSRTAQVASNIIYFPMMFLSGSAIPLEVLPEHIRSFGKFLPLTHVVTLLRGLWSGDPISSHFTEIIVLSGVTVVGIIISVLTFKWE